MIRNRTIGRVARVGAIVAVVVATSCSGGRSDTADTADTAPSAEGPGVTAPVASGPGRGDTLGAVGPLESAAVHTIAVSFEQAAYTSMLATYSGTSEKDWIEATVSIDGSTYKRAGMRLKGNSSLRMLGRGGTGSALPESLPWLIKLDKFVDGQEHKGLRELVVRSNNSATSLNEAVALELLERAGLAAQDAIASSFSVNDSKPVLRLVIESPDAVWMAERFDASGALYKAESTGDWSYRGTDPKAYDNVFDQEAGKKNADLGPLIEFLNFVNNSDEATFKAQLPQKLDIDSFATYLAMQDLLNNFDDIDGPGNNSYLYYDTKAKRFTVVPWDYNLAFGQTPGGFPGGGFPGGGAPPNGGPNTPLPPGQNQGRGPGGVPGAGGLPGGGVPPPGVPGAAGGPRGRANVLVQRFSAVPEWQATYKRKVEELRAELYTSGVATRVLDEWKAIVGAANLVDDTTLGTEATRIAQAIK